MMEPVKPPKKRTRRGYKIPDTVVTTIRFKKDLSDLATERAKELNLTRTQYIHMLVTRDLHGRRPSRERPNIFG